MCLYFLHTLCLAEPSDVSCGSSACSASTVALAPRAVALYFLEISWKSNFILAFSLCLAPEDRYSVDKPPCFPYCFTQSSSPPHSFTIPCHLLWSRLFVGMPREILNTHPHMAPNRIQTKSRNLRMESSFMQRVKKPGENCQILFLNPGDESGLPGKQVKFCN